MSRPSRRDVLGAGTFTLLTGIAAAAIAKPDATMQQAQLVPTPDAGLLALADRFMALQAQVEAFNAGAPHTDDDFDALVIAQGEIIDEMGDHTATTMDGHRARARVLTDWHALRRMSDDMRIWPLLRDLIGGAANV